MLVLERVPLTGAWEVVVERLGVTGGGGGGE